MVSGYNKRKWQTKWLNIHKSILRTNTNNNRRKKCCSASRRKRAFAVLASFYRPYIGIEMKIIWIALAPKTVSTKLLTWTKMKSIINSVSSRLSIRSTIENSQRYIARIWFSHPGYFSGSFVLSKRINAWKIQLRREIRSSKITSKNSVQLSYRKIRGYLASGGSGVGGGVGDEHFDNEILVPLLPFAMLLIK